MGRITVLNETGDERIEWDPTDAEATGRAEREFDRLKKEGYNIYEVAETKGRRVERFDPKVGRLVAAPGAGASASRPRGMAGGPVDGINRR